MSGTNITTEEAFLGSALVAFAATYEQTNSFSLALVAAIGAAVAALVIAGHYLPPGQ